jgi:hypothetical protein
MLRCRPSDTRWTMALRCVRACVISSPPQLWRRLSGPLRVARLPLLVVQSVVLMSHLGRPDGMPKPEFSLRPVAECLQVRNFCVLPPCRFWIFLRYRCALRVAPCRQCCMNGITSAGEAFSSRGLLDGVCWGGDREGVLGSRTWHRLLAGKLAFSRGRGRLWCVCCLLSAS